jgi:hypothetical protein
MESRSCCSWNSKECSREGKENMKKCKLLNMTPNTRQSVPYYRCTRWLSPGRACNASVCLSENFFLSASVAAATTSGDPAEIWCSALFPAAAQALLIAMAQAKPTANMAIVRSMITPLCYNRLLTVALHCRTRNRTGIRRFDAPRNFAAALRPARSDRSVGLRSY